MDLHAMQPIEELLPRYCEGETDARETRRVEDWIAEDEAHQRILFHICSINLATDAVRVLKTIDTDRALAKVKREMKSKRTGWGRWTQRVAALLALPLLFSVLWLLSDRADRNRVRMTEVKTTPGMTTSVVLPDNTVVYLNSESTLRFPSRFTGDTRRVELIGEAFFEVAKNKEMRFVVVSSHQSKIEVYGTSFNVEAYENDDLVTTTLVEGSLGFFYQDRAGDSKKIRLAPCQKLIYNAAEDEPRLYATSCEVETAWKDGKLIFRKTPMSEVFRLLSKRFNVEFVFRNGRKFEDYSFTGTFASQRFERIMEYFKLSSAIRWKYLESDDIEDEKQRIEIY